MFDFISGEIKKGSKPNEFWTCCPFCEERKGSPDTNFHLGFNTKKAMWHCFRCEASPRNVKTNIENLKDTARLYETPSTVTQLRSRIERAATRKTPDYIDLDLISWELTKEHTPLAYDYMINRNFSPDEIKKYNLRVGKTFIDPKTKRNVKRWRERILFPFFDGDNCIFVCGRSYMGRDPKYINSSGSKKSVVYGLERVNGEKECIIAEGIISAIAAERATGIPAVCLLGKSNSDWALSKIRSKANRVYLSLDGGVNRERRELRRRLLGLGFEVFEVLLPEGKDPDDLGSEYRQCFDQRKKVSIG